MKGRRTESELKRVEDTPGGLRLLQLTSASAINHSTYFLQSPISSDGQTMLFISNRSGGWQLFSVDNFPEGSVRQWTAEAPIHPFSPAWASSGDRVYFVRTGAVWVVDRRTLAERRVAGEPGAQLGEVSLSADGEWIAAACKVGGHNGIAVGRVDGRAWKFIPFGRTVIHPQFHPIEPDWIEFAADPAPRMHRVRRDGSSLECLYHHGNDEFVVHETFLGQTGDLVYTVWPNSLWRMDWTTRARRPISFFNAWHIAPNRAGTAVLCDTNHPDRGMHWIDVQSGRARRICGTLASNGGTQWRKSTYALAHDFANARSHTKTGALSWMEAGVDTVYGPQWTHPHPSLSHDERIAFFTSDRSGHSQVYSVELPVGT